MMRVVPPVICIDDRRVAWGRGTGAASYGKALRQSIEQAGFTAESLTDAPLGPSEPPGRLWRWTSAAAPWPVATTTPASGARIATDVFRRAQVHFDIYGSYLRIRGPARPALMHWTYPLPLHFSGIPNVYSVLDLIPLLQPDLTPVAQARASRLLRRLRHEASHLVTISNTSRREIIDTLGWPEHLVTNTSLALDVPAPDPMHTAATCAAAGLHPGGYFLHAGTIERRKNIRRLVEAYRASNSTRALVLAGPAGWGATEELAGATGLLVSSGPGAIDVTGPRIIRIDWMARPDLLGLVHGAAAVLSPSLAEGFGLPAIEAMALDTPALTSRGGAPEEVAGGAALLVDPLDVADIAAGIGALDRDADLRERLVAAGRLRVRAFTPEAYAARLSVLYCAILAGTAAISWTKGR